MSSLKRSTRILRKAFHDTTSRKADSKHRSIVAKNLKSYRKSVGSAQARKEISDKYRYQASLGGPNNTGNKKRSRS